MDVRRAARRPQRVLLGAERESAEGRQREELAERRADAVVAGIDAAMPACEAAADEHAQRILCRRLAEALEERSVVRHACTIGADTRRVNVVRVRNLAEAMRRSLRYPRRHVGSNRPSMEASTPGDEVGEPARFRREFKQMEKLLRRLAALFVGSDDHAEAAANLFSLIASCRLHRLDPELYLRDLFRVLAHWPRDRYLELAPRYWAKTRARLDERELELPLGDLTIPPAPEEQSVPR